MEDEKFNNPAFTSQVDYYDSEENLDYDEYRSMEGCRRLFLVFITILLMAIAGGVLVILL